MSPRRPAGLDAVPVEQELELERRNLEGETVWILRARGRDWSWLGAARRYAEGKSHRWEDIEKTIGEAMARGDRRP